MRIERDGADGLAPSLVLGAHHGPAAAPGERKREVGVTCGEVGRAMRDLSEVGQGGLHHLLGARVV